MGAAAAASREAKLAAENKDLVEKLAATHQKLKQLRARSQQRESVQQAQVRNERSNSCGRDYQVSKLISLCWCMCIVTMQVCQLRGQVESLSRCASRAGSVISFDAPGEFDRPCLTGRTVASRNPHRFQQDYGSIIRSIKQPHKHSTARLWLLEAICCCPASPVTLFLH